MKKTTLLAAGAALFALAMTAPAEARRTRAAQADQAEWSEEQEARPARGRRSAEARNFWEESEEATERPARRSRRQARAEEASNDTSDERPARRSRRSRDSSDESSHSESVAGAGPRPGAWCGWYMRTRHGGSADYNLAWNWSRRGSSLSGPQVGAIVVWPHHVGEITGQTSDGKWIVLSGNDSGQVKERARSVSGAVFRSL
jgi:hypothetical protein